MSCAICLEPLRWDGQYVRWSQQCRLLDVFHSMLFLARAKLDNLLIDDLLHKDHTRQHFNHFYLFQSLVLVWLWYCWISSTDCLQTALLVMWNVPRLERLEPLSILSLNCCLFVLCHLLFPSSITDHVRKSAESLRHYHQLLQRRKPCTFPDRVFDWRAKQ